MESSSEYSAKREATLHILDTRIRFGKDVSDQLHTLPRVSADTTANAAEHKMLTSLIPTILNSKDEYSALKEKYDTYDDLNKKRKMIENIRQMIQYGISTEEEMKDALAEAGSVEDINKQLDVMVQNDDDIAFLTTLERASRQAYAVRSNMREVLSNHELKSIPGLYISRFPPKYKELLDSVVEVRPLRFSFGFIVDDAKAWKEGWNTAEKESKGLANSGYHLHNTELTFVLRSSLRSELTTEDVLLAAMGIPRISQEVRFESALKHEDFHTFYDGIRVANANVLPTHLLVDALTKAPQSDQENAESSFIRNYLNMSLDTYREELLADAFSGLLTYDHKMPKSAERKYFRVSSLFEAHVRRTKQDIEKSTIEPHRKERLLQDIKAYNADGVVAGIEKLFYRVENEMPEKMEDLRIAFSLFPLSKFRHIQSLVDFWLQEKGKNSTSPAQE